MFENEKGFATVDHLNHVYWDLLNRIGANASGDVKADGSVAFTGPLDMGGNRVINVADPTGAQDVATKAYVDDLLVGVIYRDGSVNFTGKEIFEAGLSVNFIEGQSKVLLLSSDTNPVALADNTITLDSNDPTPTCVIAFHDISLGDLNGSGNSSQLILSDSTSTFAANYVHHRPNYADHADSAAAQAAGLIIGDIYCQPDGSVHKVI